ncbi:sulfur carrier protein ThiS [Limihaloglobus sulfuriphilus]|uniref:Sulfur carrier protein ThiS n=1 Tax=Limihaloglobus sulfuriphilus TaxID=1851148 RepID=A0A1Q2MG33_9BACT|nr:sulfur carrier protein ThiS [Limihaloglobus sulfuriphilus]AQQ71614.1 sulfur carrier protein ThiS [Limihaloglobus sulfuriphilus]
MASLKVNGKTIDYGEGKLPANVAGLLENMNIDKATVVAEIDGKIVERKDFETFELKDGQSIELIRFVGGG